MELVRNEVARVNKQYNLHGSLSMVFHSGGVKVRSGGQPAFSLFHTAILCVQHIRFSVSASGVHHVLRMTFEGKSTSCFGCYGACSACTPGRV